MSADSSKHNMLRYVYTIRSTARNVTIQKRKIYYIKIKVIAFIINFIRNKSFSTDFPMMDTIFIINFDREFFNLIETNSNTLPDYGGPKISPLATLVRYVFSRYVLKNISLMISESLVPKSIVNPKRVFGICGVGFFQL